MANPISSTIHVCAVNAAHVIVLRPFQLLTTECAWQLHCVEVSSSRALDGL
jgi:hypothetical protein